MEQRWLLPPSVDDLVPANHPAHFIRETVRGELDLTLRQAPKALGALGDIAALPKETARQAAAVAQARQGLDQQSHAALVFQAGRTTLGPVALGPSIKVYEAR